MTVKKFLEQTLKTKTVIDPDVFCKDKFNISLQAHPRRWDDVVKEYSKETDE